MARITIEDCIEKISSRFELVLLAAERTRKIQAGDRVTVVAADSATVTALKEIAADTLDINNLRESFISSQRTSNFDIDELNIKDIELIGDNIIENQEKYGTNYDGFSNSNFNNFDNILLEKE